MRDNEKKRTALVLYTLINLYWLLSDLRIYVITLYVRLPLIRTIIFLKHVIDVDVLIVKILLKLVFLQVIVPKSLSKWLCNKLHISECYLSD